MITDHPFRGLHKQRTVCAFMNCRRSPADHQPREEMTMAKDGPDYPPPPVPEPDQEPPLERKGRKTS